MAKVEMGKILPPMTLPVCLVGAQVKGRKTFCTVAWVNMIDDEPLLIGLVMAKKRFTKEGIMENGAFSVNFPCPELADRTDFCGIRSGYQVDKSKVFRTFNGKLEGAPMIEECPLTMECTLDRIVEFEGTDLVIGRIEDVFLESTCIKDDIIDHDKLDLMLYVMGGGYRRSGEMVAEAYKIGKDYKP